MKITNKTYQALLSFGLCLLLSYIPIMMFSTVVFQNMLGINSNFITLLIYLFLSLLILSAVILFIRNPKMDILIIIYVFVISFLITFAFYPGNRQYMFTAISDFANNPTYILFVFSLSGYLLIRQITDFNLFIKYLYRFSLFVVIGSILTYFIFMNIGIKSQYMTFSYNMTGHTMALLLISMQKKHKISFLVGLLGFVFIIIIGARGPVISILLTLALYTLLRKTSLRDKIINITLFSTIIALIALFFESIIEYLIKITEYFGVDSRTISLIAENNFVNDSGRFSIMMNSIRHFDLIGLGLYGDRVILSGSYSHNLVVELFVQFGVVIGPIILILLLIVIFSGLISKISELQLLSYIFLATGFVKLFFSGSYLNQEPAFYVLIGLGVCAMVSKRRSNESTLVMQHNVA